jgi:hypothetical protein
MRCCARVIAMCTPAPHNPHALSRTAAGIEHGAQCNLRCHNTTKRSARCQTYWALVHSYSNTLLQHVHTKCCQPQAATAQLELRTP